MKRNYTRAGVIFCFEHRERYKLLPVFKDTVSWCKKHDSPQPAATRRRAKTLAAGGFFAAERSAVSTAKLKQTAFN